MHNMKAINRGASFDEVNEIWGSLFLPMMINITGTTTNVIWIHTRHWLFNVHLSAYADKILTCAFYFRVLDVHICLFWKVQDKQGSKCTVIDVSFRNKIQRLWILFMYSTISIISYRPIITWPIYNYILNFQSVCSLK